MINRRLMKETMGMHIKLICSIFCALLAAVSICFEYWNIAVIVNQIFLLNKSIESTYINILLVVISLLARVLFMYISEREAANLADEILFNIRKQYIDALFFMNPLDVQEKSIGKIMSVFLEGIDHLDRYYRLYLPQIFKSILIPLIYIIIAVQIDWISALIFFITIPIIPIFMFLIGLWTKRNSEKQWIKLKRLAAYLQDVLRGLETLKILGKSQTQGAKIHSISEDYRKTTLSVQRWAFLSSFTLELISTLSIAMVAAGLGLRLIYGEIDYLSAFFVLLIAPECYQSMRELGMHFHASLDAEIAMKDIYDIIDIGEISAEDTGNISFEKLRFECVTYRYPNSRKNVIERLSFEIRKGEKIALIGKSGSGKTTILDLAMGFLKPDTGNIYVNEQPIDQVLKKWHSSVSLVQQSPQIFSMSLAQNILLTTDEQYDRKKLETILDKTGLMDLFNDEQEINMMIGQGHNPLSGGQKALMAIARAFVQDRNIIFLDEPTENLDLLTENKIVKDIFTLLENRTTLIIAHRLHTIKKVDRILLIDQGQIIADGSYTYLYENNGAFRAFIEGENV